MTARWTLRLTTSAEHDFTHILRWTAEYFGRRQASTYATTLRHALRDLAQGPSLAGCRPRTDIGQDIHTLHVARAGRKGRHFVVLRANATTRTIDVLRLLHDSMDLPQHLPTAG